MVNKSIELSIVEAYFALMWNGNLMMELASIYKEDSDHGSTLLNRYWDICEDKGMKAAPSIFWHELSIHDREKIVAASLKRAGIDSMKLYNGGL